MPQPHSFKIIILLPQHIISVFPCHRPLGFTSDCRRVGVGYLTCAKILVRAVYMTARQAPKIKSSCMHKCKPRLGRPEKRSFFLSPSGVEATVAAFISAIINKPYSFGGRKVPRKKERWRRTRRNRTPDDSLVTFSLSAALSAVALLELAMAALPVAT